MPDARSTGRRGMAWVFVAFQAALLVGMVVAPRSDHWTLSAAMKELGRGMEILGTAIGGWSAFALGSGLTPSPLPNGKTELVSRGPYRWMRHPMYTAMMILMGGVALLSRSWWVMAMLALLGALFGVKARWEEDRLAEAFDGYGEYRAATGRFLPVGTLRSRQTASPSHPSPESEANGESQ